MLNATVVKRINLTGDLVILHVKPDAGVPDFVPGQYVALGLPGSAPRPDTAPPDKEPHDPDKIIKRAYSLGSSPSQKDYYEVYFALLPDGALTSRLAMIKEGDRIFAAPKVVGHFTASDVPPENNLVFVATGTGLAPYMSMIRTKETWTPGRRITIVHGVRFHRDLGYREELLSLVKREPGFRYFAVVSREDPEADDIKRGYVQHLFDNGSLELDPVRDHVFLCGNPAMVEDMEKLLINRGYSLHTKKNPEGRMHVEKYW